MNPLPTIRTACAIEVLHKINDTVDRCPLCGESRLMEATMEWGWMPGAIKHRTGCALERETSNG